MESTIQEENGILYKLFGSGEGLSAIIQMPVSSKLKKEMTLGDYLFKIEKYLGRAGINGRAYFARVLLPIPKV